MKTIHHLITLAVALATAQLTSAAVPSGINYQGRLTNSAGVPQPGTRTMNLKVYDAATSGTLLYAESMGSVAVDANGVYSFQFGATGTSSTLVTETLATTDGTALTYTKALSNTPVLAGTASVTDGTYNWNETTGNPGSPAAATASLISGFVVGATVTSGGSGYTSAPAVTITGNGSGAAATATVSSGAVSAITITSAGSGYTTGATITIAAPPAPFVINYTGGTITATYATVPVAGKAITATYRYSATGISGALAAGAEQWLELTVDGVAQSPRQKVLAVPFAMKASVADSASGTLAQQISELSKDLALLSGGMQSDLTFAQNFASSKSSVIIAETTLMDKGTAYAPITELASSIGYTGGTTLLTQSIQNMLVRGSIYHCGDGRGGGNGSLTFTYTDNTSAVINLFISNSDQYQSNPNPSKPVKQVDLYYGQTYSYGLVMTTRMNQTGVLALSIPGSLSAKSKIGLYLNSSTTSPGDLLSAQLVGSTGSQSITVNGYSNIQNSIGTPQKILVTFSASVTNLAAYSSISGYVIRFSD